MLARPSLAALLFALLCPSHAQDERPPSTTTPAEAPTVSASASSTSTAPPATTTSHAPAFPPPESISAPFSAYPVASALYSPIPSVLFNVTPAHPLPVQDGENGPWLVPDFLPAWESAWARAHAIIANLTLPQKVNVTTGVGWMNGPCVGNIPPVGDWPGLCLQDSPLGVRFADYVTAFPAGINTATTWNRHLIRARGLAMGLEFRNKGVHVALGPMMNLGRVAEGGRNWEGFGADPYLAGEAAFETITGMQKAGVQACAKHYINNEQEHARTMSSSDVDDRTQHELYAHPFLRSIMAGVASVMCSYNLVNGSYACENDKMLNDVLKREFGFRGYVQSDWAATHSTLAALAGLDMTMPGDVSFGSGDSYFGGNLTEYVQNGTIPEGKVDDMATRIIAAYFFVGQDNSYPAVNFNSWNNNDPLTNTHEDVQDDHAHIVREIGAASTVLLKNVNGALPLVAPWSIALIGSDAGPAKGGPNEFVDRGGVDGILAMGWGSGTTNFPYLISPLEAIQSYARKNRSTVTWFLDDWNTEGAAAAATNTGVAIVFINSDSGEQYITVDGNEGDRNNLTAWHGGDDLVLAVAAANNNTVVVVHSVGPLILEPWIEHPNVTAVLWAGLPGQEAGNALVDVLWGMWNPSGKLPYTVAKDAGDYPAHLVLGGAMLDIPYNEGLLIDYRWFDAKNITPRFEFGFGLSYTTFEYSDLHIYRLATGTDASYAALEAAWAASNATPVEEGSSVAPWLHTPAYSLEFDLRNTGTVYGGEVPQVYVRFPDSAGEPPAVLKGFTNVALTPGQTKTVVLTLSRYDLSVWDVVRQGWALPSGTVWIAVGSSSRDVHLTGNLPT